MGISRKGNETRTLIVTFLVIVLFVIAVLLLSNLAMKTTRVLVDNQYGRASAAVRINLEDEQYFFSDTPLENQLQLYRSILTQTGRYTVWPRLINFDDHWHTHESENTLPNKSLWFTVRASVKEARGVGVRSHPEEPKELPLLIRVNFKSEQNERRAALSLEDIHEEERERREERRERRSEEKADVNKKRETNEKKGDPSIQDRPTIHEETNIETDMRHADALAPKLYESPNQRKFARTSKKLAAQTAQLNASNGETRITSTRKKRIFYFFHGGATFAGSPHKYNNLHWLKTVAWLSERNGLLTDVISIDYRLQPENNMDKSVLDCVETLSRTLREYRDSVEEVHLVGFSAGCLLTLQTVLLIEQTQNAKVGSLFGIDTDNVWLLQLTTDWAKVRNKRVHLLAPLVRLDRLFINDGFDCSSLLETFTKSVFEPNGARKYDALYWIVRLRSTFPTVDKLFILDVCRNSLSNHAISLYMTLRHLGRNDIEGPLATDLTIFDESSFFVDAQLVQKIREFELTRGLKPNKYTRDAIETSPKNNDAPKILNMLHYHFFPYIVLCEASWLTMTSLLTWTPVKNNSRQLKRDENNLELLRDLSATSHL